MQSLYVLSALPYQPYHSYGLRLHPRYMKIWLIGAPKLTKLVTCLGCRHITYTLYSGSCDRKKDGWMVVDRELWRYANHYTYLETAITG